MIKLRKLLELSTAHMPNTSPDFGRVRVISFEYGFVVWVTEPDDIPAWLTPIMKYAYKKCTLILFDGDAEVVENFETWDW